MAIREVRVSGDEILTKKCREVKEITPSVIMLLDDMADTMHEYNGVGLAAPQVGILRKVVVIDIGEGLIELINPKLIEKSGEQTGAEGCLSVPGFVGQVTRPNYCKVEALDREGNTIVVEGEELLARAICHELDHLDGVLYTDIVEGNLEPVEPEKD